jgi:hypothetical protein
MLPKTYPSELISGERAIVVLPITAVGSPFIDYIPVKSVVTNVVERNTYATNGAIAASVLASGVGLQAWVDYIPVVVDTDDILAVPWTTNVGGYIPLEAVNGSFGAIVPYDPALNFTKFRSSQYLTLISIGGL